MRCKMLRQGFADQVPQRPALHPFRPVHYGIGEAGPAYARQACQQTARFGMRAGGQQTVPKREHMGQGVALRRRLLERIVIAAHLDRVK